MFFTKCVSSSDKDNLLICMTIIVAFRFLCCYILLGFLLCNQILQIVRENENTSINFHGFNNEIGASEYIVPNVIHFIRFNKTNLTFIDIIMIRGADIAQKADAISIHIYVKKFKRKYWNILQQK